MDQFRRFYLKAGRRPLLSAWLFFFAFAVISALLLQLLVLPFLFPSLHAGNGLLIGGDWVGFHRFAVELAENVVREGWGAWELRPDRQAPAGIAAVIYVFFGPHPWALVPINAAVHATTAVLLVRIVQPFVPDVRYALICVLPFVFFPSSLTWYSQIHKDGAFFLGVFLCLYGWLLLSRLEAWTGRYAQTLLALLCLFVGCFLIWVMRPYGIKLMQGIGCIFAVMLVPYFVIQAFRRKLSITQTLLATLIVFALPMALGIFKDRGEKGEVTLVTEAMLTDTAPPLVASDEGQKVGEGGKVGEGEKIGKDKKVGKGKKIGEGTVTAEEERRGAFAIKAQNVVAELQWKKTDWLPDFLDNAFLTLSVVRSGYAGSKGGSNIDADVRFRSAPEFLPYLPRAVQIGFTAPFPNSWFKQGASGGATFMRRISAMEMVFVYAALFFLPYALWRWRGQIETWLIFSFCGILLLLYTYITPNIGSLYRSRHGFLMLLLAFCIAGAIAARQRMSGALSPNTP